MVSIDIHLRNAREKAETLYEALQKERLSVVGDMAYKVAEEAVKCMEKIVKRVESELDVKILPEEVSR
jgi:hypothetical protein